jgi:hypothetical protein
MFNSLSRTSQKGILINAAGLFTIFYGNLYSVLYIRLHVSI